MLKFEYLNSMTYLTLFENTYQNKKAKIKQPRQDKAKYTIMINVYVNNKTEIQKIVLLSEIIIL